MRSLSWSGRVRYAKDGARYLADECFQSLGFPVECGRCRDLWIEANKPEFDYYLISNRGDLKIKHMTGRP